MGCQERYAWACVCSILVVFTIYFWFVLNSPMAHAALFPIAVAASVALLIGFQIVNSIVNSSIRNSGNVPLPDELDRIIELRASKLAGIFLAKAVMAWGIVAMFRTAGG